MKPNLAAFIVISLCACAFKESPKMPGAPSSEAAPSRKAIGQVVVLFNEPQQESSASVPRKLARSLFVDSQGVVQNSNPFVLGAIGTELKIQFINVLPGSPTLKKVLLESRTIASKEVKADLVGGELSLIISPEDIASLQSEPFELQVLIRAALGVSLQARLNFDFLPAQIQPEIVPRGELAAEDLSQGGVPLSLLAELRFSNPKSYPIEMVLPKEVASKVVVRTTTRTIQEDTCGHAVSETHAEDVLSPQVVMATRGALLQSDGSVVIDANSTEAIQLFGVGTKLKEALALGVATTAFEKRTVVERCTQVRCGSYNSGDPVPRGGFDPTAFDHWYQFGYPGAANLCHNLDRYFTGCFGMPDGYQCPTAQNWDDAVKCALWDMATPVRPWDYGKFCRAESPEQGGTGNPWRFQKQLATVGAGTEVKGPLVVPVGPAPEIRFSDATQDDAESANPQVQNFEKPSGRIVNWRSEFEVQ